MLGMLRKDRFEVSRERHVVTTEKSYSENEAEAHGFVVRVPKAERKAESIVQRFEVDDSEELDPDLGDCVLFLHDIDMPEGERFEKRIRQQRV